MDGIDKKTVGEYREEYNLMLMIDEIATTIQRRVDQAVLDKVADTLAKFGYVKVIRCRDCKYCKSLTVSFSGKPLSGKPLYICDPWWYQDIELEVYPNGFCARGERK